MPVLRRRLYPGWTYQTITGRCSKAALLEIQKAIRHRILELILSFEKAFSNAVELQMGVPAEAQTRGTDAVAQVFYQTITTPMRPRWRVEALWFRLIQV